MDDVLKALVEPHRRDILGLVRNRELAAGAIARHFRISRSAVSQHLTVLKQAGLVTERRDGTRRLYQSEPKALAGLRLFVDEFWDGRLGGLKRAAEAKAGGAVGRERISVEREIAIEARREAVWKLLVEPSGVARWMGRNASFDLRVGGRYRVEVLPGIVAAGEFLEIDPPRRLVHTWGWATSVDGPVPPGSTIVIYDLLEAGNGTRLRLCHRELPSVATAGSHARGWAHYLARLESVALGRSPGADPWLTDRDLMRRELRPASGGSPDTSTSEGVE
jgi:uncharacterized protein YndB with AHSA1/START domain/biotin operon repressor